MYKIVFVLFLPFSHMRLSDYCDNMQNLERIPVEMPSVISGNYLEEIP